MNITVYLGASEGNDPKLAQAVQELGTWIGTSGNALIYGGSESGLMGKLAKSVLAAGGKVTGVEPQFFIDAGYEYNEITELIVTKDMTERKTKMIELGDAFIAFPGGTGTLEEITEVMSKVSLKHLDAPCILYNLNGYYDSLKALLTHMIETGLSSKERQEGIYFADTLDDIKLCIYPTGNEKEMRCIELSKLSAKYKVRRLDKKDVDIIYNLSYPNTIFYQYHPPIVTEESILMDMEALPPRKSMEDKLYLGFFEKGTLVAVMDLILKYPEKETAYIGLFMTDIKYQNKGIGSHIIEEVTEQLKLCGYLKVRLGVDKGNPQSFAFWTKNQFKIVAEKEYIIMEKNL